MQSTGSFKLIAIIVCLVGLATGIAGLLAPLSIYLMLGGFCVAAFSGVMAFKPHLITAPPSSSAVATPARRRISGVILMILGAAMIGGGVVFGALLLSGIGVIAILLGLSYIRK